MPKNSKNIKDPIPKDLFDIMACPLCRAGMEYTKGRKGLLCQNCGAKYPIKGGIPVMMAPKTNQ